MEKYNNKSVEYSITPQALGVIPPTNTVDLEKVNSVPDNKPRISDGSKYNITQGKYDIFRKITINERELGVSENDSIGKMPANK